MSETARFLVSGRVQGVGFRWFTRREAVRLGLAGHARNLPDGRVEVVAQGSSEQVEALRKRLESGPALSRVDRVERHDDPHDTNTYKSFNTL